jgi:hypothetical protein
MTFELRVFRDDHIGYVYAEPAEDDAETQAYRLADRFGLGDFTFESLSGQVFNFSDGMISVNPK